MEMQERKVIFNEKFKEKQLIEEMNRLKGYKIYKDKETA